MVAARLQSIISILATVAAVSVGMGQSAVSSTRVLLSSSSSSPTDGVSDEPALSFRIGQVRSVYVWAMQSPDAEGRRTTVNGIGLTVRSTGSGMLSATDHEIYNPENTLFGQFRWNGVREGIMNSDGYLLADTNAVSLSESTGITSLQAVSTHDPLFDSTTGAYLVSRVDVQALSIGTSHLFLGVGGPHPLPVDVPGIGMVDDKGDMNGDESTDNLDLTPWALALTDPGLYQALYPDVDPIMQGDILGTGSLRLNIGPFGAFMIEAGGLVSERMGRPASLSFGSLQDTEVVSGEIAGAESQRPDATIRIYFAGDMNGDGAVDNLDIAPFALALTDSAQYSQMFPLVDGSVIGDVNEDGALNNLDIAPFLNRPAGDRAVPEPSTVLLALVGLALVRAARRRG